MPEKSALDVTITKSFLTFARGELEGLFLKTVDMA
jgi:hypothetical protein